MSKIKTSLVLEGGGLRGAYTAGALTWLIDQGIEFDSSYGISTGAVHLGSRIPESSVSVRFYAAAGSSIMTSFSITS